MAVVHGLRVSVLVRKGGGQNSPCTTPMFIHMAYPEMDYAADSLSFLALILKLQQHSPV